MAILVILTILLCCYGIENDKLQDTTKTIIFVGTGILILLIILFSII